MNSNGVFFPFQYTQDSLITYGLTSRTSIFCFSLLFCSTSIFYSLITLRDIANSECNKYIHTFQANSKRNKWGILHTFQIKRNINSKARGGLFLQYRRLGGLSVPCLKRPYPIWLFSGPNDQHIIT